MKHFEQIGIVKAQFVSCSIVFQENWQTRGI